MTDSIWLQMLHELVSLFTGKLARLLYRKNVNFSDKVAVPVALGHYDDKIELMEKILESEKINDGVSIILYGLNAAKQQFQVSKYELE